MATRHQPYVPTHRERESLHASPRWIRRLSDIVPMQRRENGIGQRRTRTGSARETRPGPSAERGPEDSRQASALRFRAGRHFVPVYHFLRGPCVRLHRSTSADELRRPWATSVTPCGCWRHRASSQPLRRAVRTRTHPGVSQPAVPTTEAPQRAGASRRPRSPHALGRSSPLACPILGHESLVRFKARARETAA